MAKRLETYRAKRDFEKTSEPRGGQRVEGEGRFVVQEHRARRLHWDLRMEHDGVAVSWALPRGIPAQPDENRLAVHTEDHPLEYLEFEGEIPKGEYGAGTPRGSAQDTATPSCSILRSQCRRRARCSWTTKRPSPSTRSPPGGSEVFSKSRLAR